MSVRSERSRRWSARIAFAMLLAFIKTLFVKNKLNKKPPARSPEPAGRWRGKRTRLRLNLGLWQRDRWGLQSFRVLWIVRIVDQFEHWSELSPLNIELVLRAF